MTDQEKQLRSRSNKNDSECCSGSAAIMKELKALNTRLDRMQIDLENKVNSRIDSMQKQVNSRVDQLCGSMEKLIAENKDAGLKEIEKATKDMRANLDTEVELSSVQVKIAVLRRESKLNDNERFNKVYVSSAKSHAGRLLELNFRSLIRETAVGKDFYLTGNGRLMKRTQSSRSVAREAGLGSD
ncbi:PREDICTED: uncharacterized protein LOC106519492 [Xyrichtys novacula]|uniref:PREDICTED: uncharacterized protein LOC106519492 n=1 Tax=Xyrichtys novacula TaxID=13765 RepID=A0AAV1GA68_XYRNO|nr:PREDICTED: uncharacterized protein LOC106519492 [Xyrichtys novacula]